MSESFRALVVDQSDATFSLELKELTLDDLPPGDVMVRVAWSAVNYKDGLAGTPDGRIVESYPMIPGIDLAGTIIHSEDSRFKEGDEVIVASAQLGVSHCGGFSEMARVPGDWVIPLPKGLSLKESMILGTAGFTAAMVHSANGGKRFNTGEGTCDCNRSDRGSGQHSCNHVGQTGLYGGLRNRQRYCP